MALDDAGLTGLTTPTPAPATTPAVSAPSYGFDPVTLAPYPSLTGATTPPAVTAAPRTAPAASSPTGQVIAPGLDPIGLTQLGAAAPGQTTAPGIAPATVTPPTTPTTKLNNAQMADAVKNILGGVVLQNPLNAFHQTNYRWRLFMTQDIDPAKVGQPAANEASPTSGNVTGNTGSTSGSLDVKSLYAAINAMSQVTLAQTGVTEYNIKSVEFQGYIGPQETTRMLNMHDMIITIVEPMGIGFAESILAAAQKLRVRNYVKSFFYLELTFIAYNEDGTPNYAPCAALGNTTDTWLWQIAITNIDTHFDAGGGTYILKAIPWQEHNALDNDIYMVPSTLVISGGTLGKFTDSLAKAMSDSWKQRYANSVITYKIVWHPFETVISGVSEKTAADFPMKWAQGDLSTKRQFTLDSASGTPTATMQTGVPIDKFIEAIISNNETAQKLMKDGAPIGTTDRPDSTQARQQVLFRIECDVEMGKFEVYSQQYYRTLTYHIRPYTTQAGLIDVKQQAQALPAKVSWDAMRKLIEKGLCKKHYDYLYTGLNTEVLDFDIRYNYAFNAGLPKNTGYDQNADANASSQTRVNPAAPGATPPTTQQELAIDIEKNTTMFTAKTNEINLVTKATADSQSTSLNDTQKAAAAAILAGHPSLTDLNAQKAALGSTLSDQKNTFATNAANAIGQVENGIRVFSEQLLEDPNAGNFKNVAIDDPRILPVSFQQNWKDSLDNTKTGTSGQYTNDKTIFGAVLGQLYTPQQLLKIDLTIRGDPFWLGETNLGRLCRSRSGDSLIPVEANMPEYYRGDVCFVVSFRAPERPGDDFTPVFKPSLVFNGIYRCTNIRHMFVDGVYKQVLTGTRVPLINILAAAGYEPTSADLTGSAAVAGAGATGKGSYTGTAAGPGSGGTGAVAGPWINSARATDGVNYLMNTYGYSQAQAVAIVANLGGESSLNTGAVGDGTSAIGIGQWHPDRQAIYNATIGANQPAGQGDTLATASYDQQLDFVNYELNHSEKTAGTALATTTTVPDAVSVMVSKYERPANPAKDTALRTGYGNQLNTIFNNSKSSS